MAYVQPKILHCSGKRGKGSLQWVLGTQKPYLRAPSSTSSRLRTSVAPALARGMLSEDVAEPCLALVPAGTGSRVPQPQGHNRAHAGSLGIKDTNKQCLTPFFFFSKQVNQGCLMEEQNPQT